MIKKFLESSGIYKLIIGEDKVFTSEDWITIIQYLAMYVIIGLLFYLAIVKKFEPLLLLPIAFGMLLANLPGANLIHLDMFFDEYYFTRVWDYEKNVLLSTPIQQEIDAFINALGVSASDVVRLEAIEGTKNFIYQFDFANITEANFAFIESCQPNILISR